MTLDDFTINLDKPTGQYSAGETFTGKLFIQMSKSEAISEVKIRFFGAAYTHWMDTYYSHRTQQQRYVGYEGHENLFEYVVRVFGDGINRSMLPQGQTVLPFALQVPTKPLPVTCSFEDGNVTYGLEGSIISPWEGNKKSLILPVTIFTIVDLNITPGATIPVQMVHSKPFTNCCCLSQSIFIRTFIPKIGCTVGEVIPLTVEIQNQTDRRLDLRATLSQVWRLFATEDNLISFSLNRGRLTQDRVHLVPMVAASRDPIHPGESTKWYVELQIPLTAAPTPSPGACGIINMEYVLEVCGSTEDGCCSESEDFQIPHSIIVGTIPLVAPAVVTVQTPAYNETGGLA